MVEEFEEEYGKDNGEVRRQEKVESDHNYWRGGFPSRYAVRKLFGWSDKRYDREYWEKLEKRWRTTTLKTKELRDNQGRTRRRGVTGRKD